MTTHATAIPYVRQGRDIAPQGESGFHQNWYPIILSEELAAGQVKGVDFLDGRVVVYRGESGRAYVTSAFCRHLGSDLSIGKVIGEDIRCPFHHWRYDASGRCVDIPAGDQAPEGARLFVFPTVEKFGLVWAFNGAEALFDPPHFHDTEDDQLAYRASFLTALPQDPWVLLSNSCDFQHLEALHGLKIHTRPGEIQQPDPYHLEGPISFEDPNFGRMDQFTRLFGSNTLTLSGTMQGLPMCTLFSGRAIPGNATRGYMCVATQKSNGSARDDQRVNMMLEQGEAFFRSLTEDDNPIMEVARFRDDNLTASDWALAQFFEYVRDYPRAHPSQPFIT